VLAVTIRSCRIVGPASAQFFNFGGPQQRPAQQRADLAARRLVRQRFLHPFQPRRRPSASTRIFPGAAAEKRADSRRAERNVLGARRRHGDWLAYGLEMLHRAARHGRDPRPRHSGLIKYQPRAIRPTGRRRQASLPRKPDVIVVMLAALDGLVAARAERRQRRTSQ